MALSGCPTEPHGSDSSDGSQSMLQHDKKALFAERAPQERRLKPPDQIVACPRCLSLNTKFCYYNNYSLTQPRHFCKNCRRHWTAGGSLRNVPVGGGCRKNKRAVIGENHQRDIAVAKQPRSNDLLVFAGDSPLSGAGPALHFAYSPSNASTSTSYYDRQYEDATKIPIVRAQQSIRAGPSGVSQSTEGNYSSGHGSAFHATNSAHSSFEAPPRIISLGYYQEQPKQNVPIIANGDLSAIFESQRYRAAAAAAAAAGQGGEGGITSNIEMESLRSTFEAVDVQWRLRQQAQQAAQKQAMWGEEEQAVHREGRQAVHNVNERGLMESLRSEVKGKSAIIASPSLRHQQIEGSQVNFSRSPNVPTWQFQPLPQGLQTFEPVTHESSLRLNRGWAPLDIHAFNPHPKTQML